MPPVYAMKTSLLHSGSPSAATSVGRLGTSGREHGAFTDPSSRQNDPLGTMRGELVEYANSAVNQRCVIDCDVKLLERKTKLFPLF